jgi:hypothetical protein
MSDNQFVIVYERRGHSVDNGSMVSAHANSVVIIEFYFKSCRVYSNIGKTRTGGRYDPATGSEMFYSYILLVDVRSKWRYRRCLGNTGECRGKRGYPGSCSESAADPGWHVSERGSVLVLLFGRAGSVLVVLLLRRAVLGTGVAAVSPVVTTVALEK